MNLKKLRKQIDLSDDKILDMLNKRARIAKQIGKLKSENGNSIYSPDREKIIISRLALKSKGPLKKAYIEPIFREIVNACRSLERPMQVAYLGPEATFTHQAAIKNFGTANHFIPVKSIADVFTEVEKDRADYGIVPVENTTEGMVNHTLDMFIESDLVICAELSMPIEHCLLSRGKSTKGVKKIFSHWQVLAQCRNWLEENLPGVPTKEVLSTAQASKLTCAEKGTAAIASNAASVLYKLNIIEKGIEDNKENYTRFLVVGKTASKKSGHDKTSIMFSVKDRVGALHDMLIPFKKRKISLTKIESRPTKKKAWEYIFFIDFLGHINDKEVQEAISELSGSCPFVKILGSYPKYD